MVKLEYGDLIKVKELWTRHGGRQHGPIVETVTMPMENLRGFLEAFLTEFGHKADKPAEPPLTPDVNQ